MKSSLSLTILYLFFSGIALAQTNPFEPEIRAFEKQDSIKAPKPGQILLYGSSTLRLWDTYAQDFACKTLSVVNRGFGGSQTSDANLFFERVVVPQKPKYLFFYEGDNDLNAGKSVETILADFQVFMQKMKTQLPNTRVIIFAVKPSPSRIKLFEQQKALNKQFKQLARKEKQVYFIDTFTPMLGKDGKPDPALYKADMLHMNAQGYQIWTERVQKLLKRWKA